MNTLEVPTYFRALSTQPLTIVYNSYLFWSMWIGTFHTIVYVVVLNDKSEHSIMSFLFCNECVLGFTSVIFLSSSIFCLCV